MIRRLANEDPKLVIGLQSAAKSDHHLCFRAQWHPVLSLLGCGLAAAAVATGPALAGLALSQAVRPNSLAAGQLEASLASCKPTSFFG